MGFLSHYLAYKVGKSIAERGADTDEFASNPDCLFYEDCLIGGGCVGRACEFAETEDE